MRREGERMREEAQRDAERARRDAEQMRQEAEQMRRQAQRDVANARRDAHRQMEHHNSVDGGVPELPCCMMGPLPEDAPKCNRCGADRKKEEKTKDDSAERLLTPEMPCCMPGPPKKVVDSVAQLSDGPKCHGCDGAKNGGKGKRICVIGLAVCHYF